MIVSVLGGSSQSTPVLLNWLAEQTNPDQYTIRLAGRHRQRLAAVERACKVVAPGIRITAFESADWAECVNGSNVVLIQVRIGGYQGRQADERLALNYSIPGDEGLGPGGLAAAVRTWPELRRLLQLVRYQAPNALPLLLTSPGSLLVRLASLEWANWPLYSVCELPYTTLKNVCAVTGIPIEEITFSYTGVNHLGFLHTIKNHSIDVIEQYANHSQIPFRDIVRNWRAVPLKYLRLHFERASVVLEQRTLGIRRSRAYALAAMQRDAMGTFETGDAETIRKKLGARDADWYTEAVGPFIAAMAGSDVLRPFFLTRAEDGDIQERACSVTRGIVSPLPCREAPAAVTDLTGRFIAYERAAALAITNRNRESMIEAIRLHPWLERTQDAEGIANEIVGRLGLTELEELLV